MKKIVIMLFLTLGLTPVVALADYSLSSSLTYMQLAGKGTDYTTLNAYNAMRNISELTDGDINTLAQANYNSYFYVPFKTAIKLNKIKAFLAVTTGGELSFAKGSEVIEKKSIRMVDTGEIVYTSTVDTLVDGVFIRAGAGAIRVQEFQVYAVNWAYENVEDLALNAVKKSIDLSWSNPNNNEEFEGVKIYRDGQLIKTLDKAVTSYKDSSISSNTPYTYTVKSVFSDNIETDGVSGDITTLDFNELEKLDVTDLKADPSYNRINLSWKLPGSDDLKHVDIYRDTINEKSWFKTLIEGVTVGAADTKIFETNGTYFNDLTVKELTTYEYTLKGVATDGQSSEGVTLQVTTLEETPPVLVGGVGEQQPNGDYKFTWEQPTTGKVKILIDGKEHEILDASTKELIIPANKVIRDMLGNPLISIIPISETGKEGVITKPGKDGLGVLPIKSNDLLETGSALLWYVSPLLLLALSFLLVPKLRKLITSAFKTNNKEPRATKEHSKAYKEPRATKEHSKAYKEPRVTKEHSKAYKEPRVTKEHSKAYKEPRRGRRG